MARLTALHGISLSLLCVHALLPASVSAQQTSEWNAPIAEASARFGIPEAWIRSVIQAESRGQATLNGRPVRSPVGAMGLMQLMPGTWRAMRRRHGLGADPDDPRDNILAGTAYLRAMYDRFGYPGLFAAYNAGPARYADHLARGTRLPAETVTYLARVTRGSVGIPTAHSLSRVAPICTDALWIHSSSVLSDCPADREVPTSRSRLFFELGQAAR
jgi:hypothetical protein